MARRIITPSPPASKSRGSRARSADPMDDQAVRAYLRALVGSPVRSSERVETTEPSFIDAVARWAERSEVDRKTLSSIGVGRRVLDAAGLKPTAVAETIRRYYKDGVFSIAALVQRSGVSAAIVRKTVYEDEVNQMIERFSTEGRTILYRLVR